MRRRATRQNSAPRIGHVGIIIDCAELRSRNPDLVGHLATIIALEQDDRCRVRLDDKAETEAVIPVSAFLSEFSSNIGQSNDCAEPKKPRRSPARPVKTEPPTPPTSAFKPVEPKSFENSHDLAMLKETAKQLTALHSSSVSGRNCPQQSSKEKDSDTICAVCSNPFKNYAMIQCDSCDCWVHAKCDGISPAKLSRIRKAKDTEYVCPTCRQNMSSALFPAKDVCIDTSAYFDGELSPDKTSGLLTSICVLVASIQENRRRLRCQQQEEHGGDVST